MHHGKKNGIFSYLAKVHDDFAVYSYRYTGPKVRNNCRFRINS